MKRAKTRREKIDHFIEWRILTGMIVSDDYLTAVAPMYRPVLMESAHAKTVAEWCSAHFKQYGKAPGRDIESIFESHARNGLDEDQADMISSMLGELSEEYDREDKFNVKYLLDQTERYWTERELRITMEDVTAHLSNGDVDKAKMAFETKGSVKLQEVVGSEPFLDQDKIVNAIEADDKETLFQLSGKIGEFLGAFERDTFISILAPEKRGKCLTGDTMILLSDGKLKPMEQVIKDKDTNIISLDETTMKFVNGKVIKHIRNGKKRVNQITTKTGREIKATLNHPFLTPDGWKKVRQLKIGDYIASVKEVSVFGNRNWPEHKIKLFAYLITEGCLRTSSSPTFTSTYSDIQKDFARQVEIMGDKVSITCDKKTVMVVNHESRKGKHNQNRTKQWAEGLGLWGKLSKEKVLPDEIFQLKKKDLSLLLRIMYSCDGSVHKGGIEYSSASKKLVNQISHLLQRFGILASTKKSIVKLNGKQFPHWTICIRDLHNMSLFMECIGFAFHKAERAKKLIDKNNKSKKSFLAIFPWQIVRKVNFIIDTHCEKKGINKKRVLKRKLHEAIQSSIKNKKNLMCTTMEQIYDVFPLTEIGDIVHSQIFWDKIKVIKNKGYEETYDIAADVNHNFVANGIVAHNTYWLIEFALRAMSSRLNVAFFEAGDMSERQLLQRMLPWISRRPIKKSKMQSGPIMKPILDCNLNQFDECGLKCRTSSVGVKESSRGEDACLSFEEAEEIGYEPCTVCLKAENPKGKFIGAVWHKQINPEPLTTNEAVGAVEKFMKRSRRRFKLSDHPNGTLSVTDIKNILATWERMDGFVPDVIIVDYADILAPENSKQDFRHSVNDTWKALRALSQQFHCCVITATQADAASYEKRTVTAQNFSEDKRKYSHVNMVITLNQTDDERQQGIMRVGKMFVRESAFDPRATVSVLECRAIGRPNLGSF